MIVTIQTSTLSSYLVRMMIEDGYKPTITHRPDCLVLIVQTASVVEALAVVNQYANAIGIKSILMTQAQYG